MEHLSEGICMGRLTYRALLANACHIDAPDLVVEFDGRFHAVEFVVRRADYYVQSIFEFETFEAARDFIAK